MGDGGKIVRPNDSPFILEVFKQVFHKKCFFRVFDSRSFESSVD